MSKDVLIIVLLAILSTSLLFWNIYQQTLLSKIKKNQKDLFTGTEGVDLEKIILKNKKKIKQLDEEIKDLYEITEKVHSLAIKGIHKIGMVRFNPFRDIGGDQSFSLALLDGDTNGVTITSIYSREGVRVYAKSIKEGKAIKHQLTEEEVYAISIASENKTTKSKSKLT